MERIIVSGFGGQGVLSLGQLLAYAALYEDKAATWLPAYGPEMRGGTANCAVVIDDKEIASPVVAKCDTLIAMNLPSIVKFEDSVVKGGRIIINSSLVAEKCKRDDVKAYYVDANKIAIDHGNPKASNLVVLGAYIKITGLFTKEVMLDTIAKSFKNKPQFIPSNQECFNAGYDLF